MKNNTPPLILAPAGNRAAFLAALAAEADAVYCGLKDFSARMEAKNFSTEELASLTQLAHKKGVKVYIALNSLMKPGDADVAGKLLDQLNRHVKPDALIIQDLSVLQLAEQTGFSGQIHFSALANVSFPAALKFISESFRHRISRVVIPRELSIDEIKIMSAACPPGLELEVFVHGALCYGVSGRCYWSSWLGGKSGLRGRCVQPCRRLYARRFSVAGEKYRRFFSCQDLSLDVLTKVLKTVPNIGAWKIEGRKKGPHYVFYTVSAYRMLRDQGHDPRMKKAALELLERSLGRSGTHYNFLSQRPQNPIDMDTQTGSGFLMGKVKGTKDSPYLVPREELLPGDLLRIGYEDESWHATQRVGRHVPGGGRLYLKFSSPGPRSEDIPVFLTDRREKALEDMLEGLEKECPPIASRIHESDFHVRYPRFSEKKKHPNLIEFSVKRMPDKKKPDGAAGFWLSDEITTSHFSFLTSHSIYWWLPPVIWPEDESKWDSLIQLALKNGSRNFVLNAPWQTAFFREPGQLSLWAGPFCNIANPLAVKELASLGFSGVIVSPELGAADYLDLPKHSSLPLGIVISGNWPLSVSRVISDQLKTDVPFFSPKGEEAWAAKYGSDIWIFPNWQSDITEKKKELQAAGYSLFVHLSEPLPEKVKLKKRPGIWNWDISLL
ncbi:MAG: peptidase U32 [Desulfobacteraceae bacterium IS3]|nr:MAG: peptidase U32 [Desulfobacteraceae bacterium IS3]